MRNRIKASNVSKIKYKAFYFWNVANFPMKLKEIINFIEKETRVFSCLLIRYFRNS